MRSRNDELREILLAISTLKESYESQLDSGDLNREIVYFLFPNIELDTSRQRSAVSYPQIIYFRMELDFNKTTLTLRYSLRITSDLACESETKHIVDIYVCVQVVLAKKIW